MTAPQILLVGIQHADPRGKYKINAILEHYRPETVLVEWDSDRAWGFEEQLTKIDEFPEESVAEFRQLSLTMLDDLDLPPVHIKPTVQIMKAIGFEYIAAETYCHTTGKSFKLCDTRTNSDIRKEGEERKNRMTIDERRTGTLDALYHPERIYHLDRMPTRKLLNMPLETGLRLCDDKFVEEICNSTTRTIAINGLTHLFGNYNNIYERVKGPNVRRMTLSQKDVDEFLREEPNW